jgi:hypothetical protein
VKKCQSQQGYGAEMTHDELLAKIELPCEDDELVCQECAPIRALRAVVELIQKKQKFLENTKGDIPMTNQQLGAREERTKLLAEIKQAIEKELK